jgi:hypothetical protein
MLATGKCLLQQIRSVRLTVALGVRTLTMDTYRMLSTGEIHVSFARTCTR